MSTPDEDVADVMERFAIQEVIFTYSDAVTRADYGQMRSVFTPNAVWESAVLGMHFDTAQEFIDFVVEGSKELQVLMQTASNPVVELTAVGTAVATTTIRETILGIVATDGVYGPAGTAINVDQYGIYYDELAKADGRWLFTHRCFVPFLIATGTVAGDVVTARPLVRPDP